MNFTKDHSNPTFRIWCAMRNRCNNKNNKSYFMYGAVGVRVCERWDLSFDAFMQDMGDRPPKMSIDRFPDCKGNYEPGNCRWATDFEQANNRRNSIYIDFSGKRLSVAEWARELAVPEARLYYRITHGWTPEKALFGKRHLRDSPSSGRAVLTPERVLELRQKLASGHRQKALASEYGVSSQTISAINTRKVWQWLPA